VLARFGLDSIFFYVTIKIMMIDAAALDSDFLGASVRLK
jgi:hypothetical protein